MTVYGDGIANLYPKTNWKITALRLASQPLPWLEYCTHYPAICVKKKIDIHY